MSCYSSSLMLSSVALRNLTTCTGRSRQLLKCTTLTQSTSIIIIRTIYNPRRDLQCLSLIHKDGIQQQQQEQTASIVNNNNNTRFFFSKCSSNDNTTNDTIVPFTLFGIAAAAASISIWCNNNNNNNNKNNNNVTMCEEAAVVTVPKTVKEDNLVVEKDSKIQQQPEEVEIEELFYGLFPKRQLYVPKIEYPLWDDNWDGLQPKLTGNSDVDKQNTRQIRKDGITKHILLIRHGQYDETHKQDNTRILTPLGISQAHYTGKRLQQLMMSLHPANTTVANANANANTNTNTNTVANNNTNTTTTIDNTSTTTNTITTATGTTIQTKNYETPCNIRTIRVSCLTRAKETADIIASYLIQPPNEEEQQHEQQSSLSTSVQYISDGDCNLNEGRPCHTIPPMSGTADKKLIKITDEQHPRIEKAYQTYFYRNTTVLPSSSLSDSDSESKNGTDSTNTNSIIDEKHEFEIIVCHANVIRYFLCRALQLPPEVWLRYCPFNCSITYVTIRPTGTVSCRMVGDIGHLPYNHCTFSQHHGFNW